MYTHVILQTVGVSSQQIEYGISKSLVLITLAMLGGVTVEAYCFTHGQRCQLESTFVHCAWREGCSPNPNPVYAIAIVDRVRTTRIQGTLRSPKGFWGVKIG